MRQCPQRSYSPPSRSHEGIEMTFNQSSRLGRREFSKCMATGVAAALFVETPIAAWAQAITAAPNVTGMKIAMIGAGREGSALGTLYAKHDHPVMFASRH